MEKQRVPIVQGKSREVLERSGIRFLKDVVPDCLKGPIPVPIAEIVEFDLVHRHPGLIVHVSDLPSPIEAITDSITHPGEIHLTFTQTVYDGLVSGRSRSRFTATHEVAHVEMHARQLATALQDGTFRGSARRSDIPAYADPEWQADYWAGCVLMNRDVVQMIVRDYGQSPEAISELLRVSVPAASKRLRYLYPNH